MERITMWTEDYSVEVDGVYIDETFGTIMRKYDEVLTREFLTHREKQSSRQIAKDVGCNKTTVLRRLKKLGMTTRRHNIQEDEYTDTMIKCRSCKTWKPKEDFPVEKHSNFGYRLRCKACRDKAKELWEIDNKEHVKEQREEYYATHTEQIQKQAREHYYEIREIIREKHLLYDKSGILKGTGICLMCGELDFRALVLHHVDTDLGVSLCANCHRRYQHHLNHQNGIARAIEGNINEGFENVV